MSLTSRILIGFALIGALGLYLLLNPIMDGVERQYLEAAEEPMVDAAEILAAIVASGIDRGASPTETLSAPFVAAKARKLDAVIYDLRKQHLELDVYVTDDHGIVLFDSGNPKNVGRDYSGWLDVDLTLHGKYGARASMAFPRNRASLSLYVAAPIRSNNRTVGVLTVYKPQRALVTFIDGTRDRIRTLGLIAAAAMLLAGLVFSHWVTAPLRRLTDYARAAARGERPPHPEMPGVHFRILGESIEQMRESLENRRYVETYLQTLTHELKSPLAGIRGASEILLENPPEPQRTRFLENIRNETDRLHRLAERLLMLAALEQKKALTDQTRVDLSALVAQACDQIAPQAESRGVTFHKNLDGPAWVLGDEILLGLAVSNLLQNAVEFSPDRSTVDVALRSQHRDWILEIADAGSGIPPYAQARIFERFYSLPRPVTAKKSTGLGLCLAREAASLHGGSVSVANREGKPGALATLTIPASGLRV